MNHFGVVNAYDGLLNLSCCQGVGFCWRRSGGLRLNWRNNYLRLSRRKRLCLRGLGWLLCLRLRLLLLLLALSCWWSYCRLILSCLLACCCRYLLILLSTLLIVISLVLTLSTLSSLIAPISCSCLHIHQTISLIIGHLSCSHKSLLVISIIKRQYKMTTIGYRFNSRGSSNNIDKLLIAISTSSASKRHGICWESCDCVERGVDFPGKRDGVATLEEDISAVEDGARRPERGIGVGEVVV